MMKPAKIVIAIPLLALSSVAYGEQLSSQIEQDSSGQQLIHQTVKNQGTPLSVENIQQIGGNLTNSVESSATTLRNISQEYTGQQITANEIISRTLSALTALTQESSNVANVVRGTRVQRVDQKFTENALQQGRNIIDVAVLPGSVSQYGLNSANLIYATESIGIGSQDFSEGSTQKVENIAKIRRSGAGGNILQKGENLGNIIIADRVDEVVREYSGDQIIINEVSLSSGAIPSGIVQEGVNIANYIEAGSIGKIVQKSTGKQLVTNKVTVTSLDGYTREITSHPNLTQTSQNYVNMIIMKPSSDGNAPMQTSIEQSSTYDQMSSNTNGQSVQVGNSASIER